VRSATGTHNHQLVGTPDQDARSNGPKTESLAVGCPLGSIQQVQLHFCMDDTIVSLVHSMHVCSLIRSVQSCLICMCVAVNEVGKCVISHCHHSADTVCVCVSVVLHGHRPVVVREERKKGVLMQSEKMLALQICQVKEYACGTSPGVCISNTSYTCIWHVRVCLQAVVCFLRFV
jgi:hypothetical protein